MSLTKAEESSNAMNTTATYMVVMVAVVGQSELLHDI